MPLYELHLPPDLLPPLDAASAREMALRLLGAHVCDSRPVPCAVDEQAAVALADLNVWMCDNGVREHLTERLERVLIATCPLRAKKGIDR